MNPSFRQWLFAFALLAVAVPAWAQLGTAPVVDTAPSPVGSTATQEELENLPTVRDPYNLLRTVPGALGDRVNVGGSETGNQSSFVSKGGSINSNMFAVDGFDITNLSSLGSTPNYYAMESLKEFQVITNGYTAEYGGRAGGVVNIVTKSGTNDLHGTAFFGSAFPQDFKDSSYRNPGGQLFNDSQDYGFSAGGPIRQNKTWFFGSYERANVDRTTFAAGTATPADFTGNNFTGKVTWTPTTTDSVTGLVTGSDLDRLGQGASESRDPGATWNVAGGFYLYGATYNKTLPNGMALEVKGAGERDGYDATPRGGGLAPVLQAGIFRRSFFDYNTDNSSAQFSGNLRWSRSAEWTFNLGGGYRGWNETGDAFVAAGTITSLDASPTFPLAVFTPESHWDISVSQTYLHGEATYRTGRLTLGGGLRWDSYGGENNASTVGANPLRPTTVPSASFAGNSPELSWGGLAPRVNLAWDVRGNGRTVVRGGWGLYYDALPTTTVARANPILFDLYRGSEAGLYNDTSGDWTFNPGEALGQTQFFGGVQTSSPNYFTTPNQLAAGLEAQRISRLFMSLERHPCENFSWDATYTHSVFSHVFDDLPGINTAAGPRVIAPGDYVDGPIITATDTNGDATTLQTYRLNPAFSFTGGTLLQNGARERGYDGVSLGFRHSLANKWMLRGHFTLESAKWDVPSSFFQDANNVRNSEDNDGGATSDLSATDVKSNTFLNTSWYSNIGGMYQIHPESRYGVDVGANMFLRGGYPMYPYTQFDPGDGEDRDIEVPDDARYDGLFLLDARIQKPFRFNTVGLTVGFDIFNLTNADTVMQQNSDSRTSGFLDPVERISPRTYQITARFTF